MSVATNKAIVRRLFAEVYNRRIVAATDEFIAPDLVNHSAPFTVRGPKGARRAAAAQFDAFPECHTTIEDIISEGDKVVVRATDHFTDQRDPGAAAAPALGCLSAVGIVPEPDRIAAASPGQAQA